MRGTDEADTLTGSSAADTLRGLGGADTLTGNAGDDILVGGMGNDIVKGGGGNDIYIWKRGDGDDALTEDATSSSADDRLMLEGVEITDVTVSRSGEDVVLVIAPPTACDTNERITLKNNLVDYRDRGIDRIMFADGTTWTRENLRQLSTQTKGTEGTDALIGSSMADILKGQGGNDTLTGNGGDDLLVGGTGNDTLTGGTGNDIYQFNRGDGKDIIDNRGQSAADDRVLLGEGIGYDQLWLEQAAKDLKISILGSDDTIQVKDWFASSANRLDLATADGYSLTDTAVNQLVQAMAGFGAVPYGSSDLPAGIREGLTPVLAANWQKQAS
jgi:Ca2+-binding RTX toxin-like protein